MKIFAMKIYYIFSQNDLNISHTKNHSWGELHFKNIFKIDFLA